MPEIRAVFRMLRRSSASSLAALGMLAAAAAVATATFSFADALLWRALPYRDAGQLALLVTTHVNGEAGVSLPDFTVLRDHARGAQIAAAGTFVPDFGLSGFGEPRQLRARLLSARYFETLGVPLVAGRDFRRDEERPGAGTVAIITDRLWADLFWRRTDILGTPLPMNGRSYVIVGILPPYRDPFGDVDVYVPHQFSPTLPRGLRLMTPLARLATGVSPQGFQREVEQLTGKTDDPAAVGYRVELIPLHARLAARHQSAAALLFGGAVAVLAIALLNFAVLAATRARQRVPEFSTRLALGATRGRIVRLAACELVPLAIAAMALAVPAGSLIVRILRSQYADGMVTEIAIGARTVAFVATILAVSVVATFGAASRSFRAHVSTQRSIASSRLRGGRSFVVAQMAMSLALVIGSGLLAKSFVALSNVSPGFETRDIHTTRIAIPAGRYGTAGGVLAAAPRTAQSRGSADGSDDGTSSVRARQPDVVFGADDERRRRAGQSACCVARLLRRIGHPCTDRPADYRQRPGERTTRRGRQSAAGRAAGVCGAAPRPDAGVRLRRAAVHRNGRGRRRGYSSQPAGYGAIAGGVLLVCADTTTGALARAVERAQCA
jgi:putative ABC transport system permease protein